MKKRSYDFLGFAGAFIVLSSLVALWAATQVRGGVQPTRNAASSPSSANDSQQLAARPDTASQPPASTQTRASQPQTMGQTNLQRGDSGIAKTKLPVAKTIAWEPDYEAALQRARAEGKPLMVDFYTDWCSACKQLDANVYTKSAIIASTQKFVCVKVNAEKRRDLAGAYGVTGFPTISFVRASAEGNILLGALPGAVDAQTFSQVLTAAQTQYQQAGVSNA